MLPDEKIGCHYSGMKMTCFEGVTKHKCQMWALLEGTDPKDGSTIHRYGCAAALQHIHQWEMNKQLNEIGASIQSLRNEQMQIAHSAALDRIEAEVKRAVESGKPQALLEAPDAKD